jgi:two-component system, cell cycle sensor histidine kinase and response regulator CckA
LNTAQKAPTAFHGFPWPLAIVDAQGRVVETNGAWRAGRARLDEIMQGVPVEGDLLFAHVERTGRGLGRRVIDLLRPVLAGTRDEGEGVFMLGRSEYRLLATRLADEADARFVLLAFRPALPDERHRAIFVASPVGIALLDPPGHTLEVNPAMARLLGVREADSAVPPGVLEALDESERPRAIAALEELFSGEGTGWVRETHLHRADGEAVPVRMHVSASRAGDGDPMAVVLVEDISERTRLEQQLSQAQRIESVGRLAGGIAHDFNNLVTIIRGHTDLLLGEMAPDDPLRADLEDIRVAGERAAALTGQLLAFSRRNVLQPRVLDLNSVVGGMEGLLRRTLGEDVQLVIELAPRLGSVRADPAQMEQVLLNLVVNARDAMPRGGRLCIRTWDQDLDDAFVAGHLGSSAGPHVVIQVQDSGHGMDEGTMALIFEPFFTTKEPGKGTGLGLAMSYGIVKQSGGYIAVRSRPGEGATFTIYLPRVGERPAESSRAPSVANGAPGSETVLVVEDEPALRQLAARVLEGRGYEVLTAASGQEAMLAARTHPGRIHLLLTDVVMPGMGGRELAERLQSEMPTLRVLYTSGYTDDDIVRHGVSERDAAFLAKPFTPDELAAGVRAALDGPRG